MNLPGPNSIPNGLAEHLTDKYVPRSRSLVNRPVPNAKNKMAAINERLYQSSSQDQQLQIQGPSDGTIEQNGMMYETDIKANGELIPYQISSSGRWKGKGKATTSQAQPSAVKGRAGRKPASSSSSEPKGKSSILSNPGPSSMSSKPYRRGKWKGLGKGWRKGMGGPPLTAKPLSQGGILPTHPSDKKRQYKKPRDFQLGSVEEVKLWEKQVKSTSLLLKVLVEDLLKITMSKSLFQVLLLQVLNVKVQVMVLPQV